MTGMETAVRPPLNEAEAAVEEEQEPRKIRAISLQFRQKPT
jgi:hypothetical protein